MMKIGPPRTLMPSSFLKPWTTVRYTSAMTLTLDAHAEELIKRGMELHHFADAEEVVAHALGLLATEDGSWSAQERSELDTRYDEGMREQKHGETIPAHKVQEALAEMRAARG